MFILYVRHRGCQNRYPCRCSADTPCGCSSPCPSAAELPDAAALRSLPTSIISSASSMDVLSKSTNLFQHIKFFNYFCTLSRSSATYRATFSKAQGRAGRAVRCSPCGSDLLDGYNPVPTKHSIPRSYSNEHSFAGPACFNTFSPRTAASATRCK